MSDYDQVPVEGNPFDTPYETVPVEGNPFNEPSALSNTWTGIARGVGGLLDTAGQAGLAETQAPPDQTPKPGDIEKSVVSGMTGGQPYVPQSDLGNAYQNVVAGTTAGAPFAVMGAGGVVPMLARQALNLIGNVGGEAGRRVMSDHPVVGGIIGSLLAPTIAGGAVTVANNTANQAGRLFGTTGAAEREALQRMSQQPGYNITMPQVDQTLGQLDYTGYWTANRIASAPDYQKRQAVKNLLATNSTSQAAPTPGLLSNLQNYAVSLPGLGLAAGGALDAFSHHLGLPSLPGVAEGLGLGAGDVLQKTLAPFLQRRAAAFNQSVDNLLKNNRGQVWQQYQQQQYQPSLMQRLGMGFVAPQVSNQMAP